METIKARRFDFDERLNEVICSRINKMYLDFINSKDVKIVNISKKYYHSEYHYSRYVLYINK